MIAEETTLWDSLSYEEKNRLLYERQKKMLEEFLERGAISKTQYEKSLHDMTGKMGIKERTNMRIKESEEQNGTEKTGIRTDEAADNGSEKRGERGY